MHLMCLKAFLKPIKIMNRDLTKKYVYEKHTLTIAIGSTSYSNIIQLKHGVCVGVRFIDFAPSVVRNNAIDIAVNQNDGSKLIGQTDFRDFAHGGGGFLEGYKPTNFDTKADINIDVVSSTAIAGTDFSGQLIFAIEQDCL